MRIGIKKRKEEMCEFNQEIVNWTEKQNKCGRGKQILHFISEFMAR